MRLTQLITTLACAALAACGGGDPNNQPDSATPRDSGGAIDAPGTGDAPGTDAGPTGGDGPTGIDAPTGVDAGGGGDAMLPLACNPNTQTGCAASEKCGWVVEGTFGRSACVPNGPQGIGAACTRAASGYSDCARGAECNGGTCKPICNLMVGQAPSCSTGTICSRYSSLFDEPGQEAGVCDPQCDPLTQRRGGDNAEACGSPAPAAPAKGCYTSDRVAFSCSNVPAAAAGLTDRSPAFGNGTAAYSNGCAAGFVPLLVESSDSSTVLCAGMCAPLRTDNTLASNALGDGSVLGKLPTESAPAPGNATCAIGRKGSEAAEDCRFWWWFNRDASGTQLPSPFNDTLGLCLGYTHFHYDNDSDPTTPDRSYPACASLPPRNGTPGPDGTADQWGCYNSVDANARAAPHANRVGDFRRVLGGSATRHILL